MQRFGNLWLADRTSNATSPAAEPCHGAVGDWTAISFALSGLLHLNALPRACPGLQPSAALRVLGEAFGVRTHFNYAGSFLRCQVSRRADPMIIRPPHSPIHIPTAPQPNLKHKK